MGEQIKKYGFLDIFQKKEEPVKKDKKKSKKDYFKVKEL